MDKQCEIVQDLLPLYIDKACSGASARMVEGHLPQCPVCTGVYEEMKKDTCEKVLEAEAKSVVGQHAKLQKRKSLLVGAVLAGILCIPILVCLIVNLAVGHGLDWFFIVLTSLLVFASLTVVPLVAEKQKGVYTILSFTGCLLLLLLTCAIYTGGSWFPVAGTAVVFGLAVPFLPYIVYNVPLMPFWQKNRGLLVLGTDTALLALMLVCIGIFGTGGSYWRLMPAIALYHVGYVWLVFAVCRYLKCSKWIRAGITSLLVGGFCFCENNVLGAILGEKQPWPVMQFGAWNLNTVDGNVKWLALLGCAAIGLILAIVGIIRTVKRSK